MAPIQNLCRFIVQSNHFRPSDLSVTPRAFTPTKNLKVSVSITDGVSDEDVWKKAEIISSNMGKNLYGKADLKTKTIYSNNLNIIPSATDEDNLHADISNWPEEKQAQLSIQQTLAAEANFSIRPNS